jgi:hypothetical protein
MVLRSRSRADRKKKVLAMQRPAAPERPRARVPAAILLSLALALPVASPSAASAHNVPITCQVVAAAPASLPFAATWYDKLWNKLVQSLSTREGAIQFGLIGMVICLWIIWWRRER